MAQINVFVKPNGATAQEIEPQVFSFVDYICNSCNSKNSAPRIIPKTSCEIAAIPSTDILSGNIPVGTAIVVRLIVLKDRKDENNEN